MSDEGEWRVVDCFAGPDCWCGIIVNPDGEECNGFADIPRSNCLFIVDAMNGNHRKQYRRNNLHPLPWHVRQSDSGYKWMTTTAGLTSNDMDHCVGHAFGDYNQIFVDAVNGFYQYEGKENHE
jgi:hypothetical protein